VCVAEGDRAPSPQEILRLSAAGADRLLDRLERSVPRRPEHLTLPAARSAVIFGDTHGDWLSTLEVVRAFEAGGPATLLVGLGDYVDRSPADLPCGSVANALFLLALAGAAPDRVILLQGNHETQRRIPGHPHVLPAELARLWGTSEPRYDRIMDLLGRGPLAASAANGAYFAHAGFPKGPLPSPWTAAFEAPDDARLTELVWSEPEAGAVHRGATEPWSEAELLTFLEQSSLRTFWRGHDPDLTGRSLYDGRVMTLQTTRYFRRFGGVVFATMALDRPLQRVEEAELHRLPPDPHPTAA
jgi:hypothetical protein